MKANSNLIRGAMAVAVAASCGYAAASSITAPSAAERVTAQRIAQAVTADAITIDKIIVDLDAQYSANGRVTLTLTNGQFASTPAAADCSSAGQSDMTLAKESTTANSVTYLVTGIDAGQQTASLLCTFAGATLKTSSLSGNVKVEFSATNNNNVAIDNTNIGSATLASVSDQFAFVSDTNFDGVIDVPTSNKLFTVNGAGSTAGSGTVYTGDEYGFTVSMLSISPSNTAAAGTFETTISGNFSFVQDTGDLVCSASSLTSGGGKLAATIVANAATFTPVIASDCQSLTIKLPSAAFTAPTPTSGLVSVRTVVSAYKDSASVTTAASIAFSPVAEFSTAGATAAYGALASGRAQTLAAWTAGSWTTNGTTIDVPYMPFGASSPVLSHVFTLNNRSSIGGTVKVSAWRAAGTFGGVSNVAQACGTQDYALTSVEAASVLTLTTDVTNYIRNVCGWQGQARVALQFTVATPAASTELFTAYTIDGTRGNVVVNSSNGRGATTR
jgi:hypothetical protein